MMRVDCDALECDLAETYHVFDMRKLDLLTAARLAAGLRDTSRIKQKISGRGLDLTSQILAIIFDALQIIIWQRSKEGTEKPESLYEKLTNTNEPKPESESDVVTFDSAEDFEKAWAEITGGR